MFELTQTAELSHWQGDAADKAWQAFLGDVRRFVGREPPQDASPTPSLKIAPQPLAAKPSIVVRPFAPNPTKALAAFETGLTLDPRSPWRVVFVAGQGTALFHLGRFGVAIPLLREAAEQIPGTSSVFWNMQAVAFGFLGKATETQALEGVCYPLAAAGEGYYDQVRDGSLKPKVLEGLRLAGIGVE